MNKGDYYVHDLDPISISWGGLVLPWYWLAYVVGFFCVYLISEYLRKEQRLALKRRDLIDMMLMSWVLLIVGGRLFYALVYNLSYFANQPLEIFAIWKGGMSFHGGLLGVLLGVLLLSRMRGISFFALTDLIAISCPIVLGLGRIANFINGELVGRVSTLPWAVIFEKTYDATPRHPSQVYEALGEGLLLFVILFLNREKLSHDPKGIISSYFLIFYGFIRFVLEFFRAPDLQLGYYLGFMTMGQILSLVMVILGFIINARQGMSRRRI